MNTMQDTRVSGAYAQQMKTFAGLIGAVMTFVLFTTSTTAHAAVGASSDPRFVIPSVGDGVQSLSGAQDDEGEKLPIIYVASASEDYQLADLQFANPMRAKGYEVIVKNE